MNYFRFPPVRDQKKLRKSRETAIIREDEFSAQTLSGRFCL
jgi:hypothetical protein